MLSVLFHLFRILTLLFTIELFRIILETEFDKDRIESSNKFAV